MCKRYTYSAGGKPVEKPFVDAVACLVRDDILCTALQPEQQTLGGKPREKLAEENGSCRYAKRTIVFYTVYLLTGK